MIFALMLLAQSSGAVPPAAVASQSACTGPIFAQFDFWVGEWDVYPNGKDSLVAHSRIERLYAGCAVRENWMPLKGQDGGSLNGVDPATGRWHQTWIGSQPGRVEFDGGRSGEAMVLTGFWRGVNGPGQDGLIRMTYRPLDRDTVRQHGEVSTDQGLTWQTSFDFLYRRSKPSN